VQSLEGSHVSGLVHKIGASAAGRHLRVPFHSERRIQRDAAVRGSSSRRGHAPQYLRPGGIRHSAYPSRHGVPVERARKQSLAARHPARHVIPHGIRRNGTVSSSVKYCRLIHVPTQTLTRARAHKHTHTSAHARTHHAPLSQCPGECLKSESALPTKPATCEATRCCQVSCCMRIAPSCKATPLQRCGCVQSCAGALLVHTAAVT
jgi:hypothetical protein